MLPATITRAARLVWRSDRRLALCHGALSLLQALLPLAAILTLREVIDRSAALFAVGAARPDSLGELLHHCLHRPDYRALLLWSLTGAACTGLSLAARLLAAWVAEFHALAVTEHIYALLHDAMLRMDYAFFENPNDQNRLYLAREEALMRPPRILAGLAQMLGSLAGLSGALLIALSLTPWLAPLLLLGALPALLFRFKRARRLHAWRKSLTPLEREAGYFHSVLTDNSGAKDIRLYGHGAYCQRRFAAARARLREERVAWRRWVLSREAAGLFGGLAATALILLWMTGQLLAGAVTIGSLVLCVQAVQRGQAALGSMINALAALFEDALFLQNFEELLHQPAQVTTPATPREVPGNLQQGIVFENVTFTYPGAAAPVLRNLSCTLRVGERIALAGPNGAGKTTLIKLLCRLYDPDSGRILVDGHDLREFDPTAWRAHVGALFQDFNHYQLTLRDNIAIGHLDRAGDLAAVERAARYAGVDSLAAQWPHGYDTLLGRWLHDGIEPSIGQWQKIALARVFLRPALVLALDEPASALDPESARRLHTTLTRAAPGRVTLFTSHRHIEPDMADRVLTMENGTLKASG